MMLSASVNLFDGHELLEPLVRATRRLVEHLTVVYESRSWRGNPGPVGLADTLESLRVRAWIDEVVHYDGDRELPGAPPKRHEARKRTIGLGLARRAGATHYLSLDVDEFYRPNEFLAARGQVETERLEASACQVQDYHRRPTFRCRGLAKYLGLDLYVPFITAIGPDSRFDERNDYFCSVDPSRRTRATRTHVFDGTDLTMHHMTTVRGSVASLVSKFANSTSSPVIRLEEPEALAQHVWSFDPRIDHAPVVDVVDDEFGIAGWIGAAGPSFSLAVPTPTHRRRA